MHHLNIDIETYSAEDLLKTGLYKYAQSEEFEVLLFAYSLDAGPITVVDLTVSGTTLPPEIVEWLLNPEYVKHAYNAPFEWYCLSVYLGLDSPMVWLPQWRCTMVHGLYCGYPSGLSAIGKALKMPEDKQKDTAGKALIRYFCTPCKPSASNGQRKRNLPQHDPQKWALFVQYNGQDVVTEMEVEKRLSHFLVPNAVQRQWITDIKINLEGVAVDSELIQGALECASVVQLACKEEAVKLTGLTNPNSQKQLIPWLSREMGEEVPDIKKETVNQLLERECLGDKVKRVLQLRQDMAKTSTKKYGALKDAVGRDGRVRGLLQFYGANRTGRWAGRLVQPQNLPRTYIGALPTAREMVKSRNLDGLKICYGSIPDTLSQLIRTAFVAPTNCTLVDADFSAIEARVIAWLAGEQWRLDVFNTHGKIYEASASQMFGVPLEKIKKGNPEYALRQKGKVAELALGYQGSSGALVQMGALKMGLLEDELPDIVRRWRESNPRIRDLWYGVDAAAIDTVRTGRTNGVGVLLFQREWDNENQLDFLTVTLPSQRKLYYAHPVLTKNRWGKDSISYKGMNQTTKKWEMIETYGGKLVENCTQAIARDCLAVALERLDIGGHRVVFHIHDEVVIECLENMSDLEAVTQILSQPIPWAMDLPLGADGWINPFFKKD